MSGITTSLRAESQSGTIRSLAYFVPVIEEVLEGTVGQDYFHYLRYRLTPYFPNMGKTPAGR